MQYEQTKITLWWTLAENKTMKKIPNTRKRGSDRKLLIKNMKENPDQIPKQAISN